MKTLVLNKDNHLEIKSANVEDKTANDILYPIKTITKDNILDIFPDRKKSITILGFEVEFDYVVFKHDVVFTFENFTEKLDIENPRNNYKIYKELYKIAQMEYKIKHFIFEIESKLEFLKVKNVGFSKKYGQIYFDINDLTYWLKPVDGRLIYDRCDLNWGDGYYSGQESTNLEYYVEKFQKLIEQRNIIIEHFK